MKVRKQQLEQDMEQQTGSKKEKDYVKAVYCHPACLTYMPLYHSYRGIHTFNFLNLDYFFIS